MAEIAAQPLAAAARALMLAGRWVGGGNVRVRPTRCGSMAHRPSKSWYDGPSTR